MAKNEKIYNTDGNVEVEIIEGEIKLIKKIKSIEDKIERKEDLVKVYKKEIEDLKKNKEKLEKKININNKYGVIIG